MFKFDAELHEQFVTNSANFCSLASSFILSLCLILAYGVMIAINGWWSSRNWNFESSSRSHLDVSHILDALESAIIFVLDNSLALPVGGDDLVVSVVVEDSWHLESEQVDVGLDTCLLHGVLTNVVEVALSEELAGEASKNDNFVICDLGHAGSLSFWEGSRRHIDYSPIVGAVLRIISFDRVAVLSA